MKKLIIKIAIIILAIFLLFSLAKSILPISSHIAKGNGMAPSIQKGNIFKVNKRIKKIERGDIILYKLPFDKGEYFQRIIAVPDDKIEIKRNYLGITEVYLNDKLLNEPYKIKKKELSAHPKAIQMKPVIIKKYSYFVMGDDRDLSFDSRFFGPLPKWFIKGKVTEIKK